VYHKGFSFSIDSFGLGQKYFLNELSTSGMNKKNHSLFVLPLFFYEENESFLSTDHKKWVYNSSGNNLEDTKQKIIVFTNNNIIEAVNHCRMI